MATLVHIPGLLRKYPTPVEVRSDAISSQSPGDVQEIKLFEHVTCLRGSIQNWLADAGLPLASRESIEATNSSLQEGDLYSDVLLAILDCAAHTALLGLENIRENLRSQDIREGDGVLQVHGDREVVHLRIKAAFRFVRDRSMLASQPLHLGLLRAGIVLG